MKKTKKMKRTGTGVSKSILLANTIIYFSLQDNKKITKLQLQKLMYLAYAFALAHRGLRLIDGNFEAWQYGPVHLDTYYKIDDGCVDYDNKTINNYYFAGEWILEDNMLSGREKGLAGFIYEMYKNYPIGALVNETHKPKGAWYKTIKNAERTIIIKDKLVTEEFKNLPARVYI